MRPGIALQPSFETPASRAPQDEAEFRVDCPGYRCAHPGYDRFTVNLTSLPRLIPRSPPTGPRGARPDDRLRRRIEGQWSGTAVASWFETRVPRSSP